MTLAIPFILVIYLSLTAVEQSSQYRLFGHLFCILGAVGTFFIEASSWEWTWITYATSEGSLPLFSVGYQLDPTRSQLLTGAAIIGLLTRRSSPMVSLGAAIAILAPSPLQAALGWMLMMPWLHNDTRQVSRVLHSLSIALMLLASLSTIIYVSTLHWPKQLFNAQWVIAGLFLTGSAIRWGMLSPLHAAYTTTKTKHVLAVLCGWSVWLLIFPILPQNIAESANNCLLLVGVLTLSSKDSVGAVRRFWLVCIMMTHHSGLAISLGCCAMALQPNNQMGRYLHFAGGLATILLFAKQIDVALILVAIIAAYFANKPITQSDSPPQERYFPVIETVEKYGRVLSVVVFIGYFCYLAGRIV